jgi:iron complex outermembrane receptor protein
VTEIWRATNFQRLRFTGVEANVALRPTPTQEIEWQYTGLGGAQTALGGQLSKYAFNYPVHSGVMSWQAMLPWGVAARTRVGVLQRLGRDVYGLWDVYAALTTHRRVRPFLQLSNVTNTSYEEISRVAMPGRSIIGGVEVLVFRSR